MKSETNEEYHNSGAIGHSRLWEYHQSPRLYHARYYTGEIEREETEAMRFGTAFHAALLEPERFMEDYVLEPEGLEWRSKAQKLDACIKLNSFLKEPMEVEAYQHLAECRKEEIQAFFAAKHSNVSLSGDDFQRIERMVSEVRENPVVKSKFPDFLEGIFLSERPFRAGPMVTGLHVQCKPDLLLRYDALAYVIDVKTIENMDRRHRHYRDFGYYRIPEFYRQVILAADKEVEAVDHFFLWVETKAPYRVRLSQSSQEDNELARAEISKDLFALSASMKTGDWSDPGENEVETLELSRWEAKRKAEEL